MKPPVAAVRPHSFTKHGITVTDPYAWMRDKDYPKVETTEILDYLKAENAYFEDAMRETSMVTEALFEQMKGRTKEDDSAVPYPEGDYLYWWAFDKGAQYRNWYRKPKAGGQDQLILSEPAEAEGKEYFRLGALEVSPDGKLMAYAVDSDGSERFVLKIRDLATGKDLETVAPDSLGGVAWGADSQSIVWAQASAEWRPTKVWVKKLGAAESVLVYEEKQAGFWSTPSKTQDGKFILINCTTQVTTEVYLLDATDLSKPPVLVRPRKENVSYSVDSSGDTLFIRTNDEHVNFRIATAKAEKPGEWTTLIAGSNEVYITDHTAFTSYLAVEERVNGLDQIRLVFADGTQKRIPFPEASYEASLGNNAEADAPLLRISYTSMVTPNTVYDYDISKGELITRKVQEIPSGYDASQYATERVIITVRDGAQVPVSVVYKKGYKKDGSMPLHVYGYGSYGMGMTPSFSAARLSLLDRGFAYAIAHIRGGDEMGYQWYLDGKLEKRVNTFNDFVDVTRGLNKLGFAKAGLNSASGGSAGGWLMGAVVEQAPELWGAIVAHVPFVDVLNTMLDESLPLTPGEWPEWGNPVTDPEAFKRLIELAPYEQVGKHDYPPMLITGGLYDPRVTYWEPAKWAARIRANKTDQNLLLLKINMGAGHGGKSGRFERLREVAEEYAFILMALDGKAKA